MCAICGVVDLVAPRPPDAASLVRMRDAMVHRGPDDAGLYAGAGVGLGNRRLAIIDLAGGHQPMASADGQVWITYNGELYNFRELRAELAARGHAFRTRSDTEVVLAAYEALGDACVPRLRGIFAFAIWDGRRRRLLLARDHLGVKPLYYARLDDSLVFASEVKALLQWPGIAAALDGEALAAYLAHRYVPGPRTMFRGISKLPPGHLLTASAAGVAVRAYWDLPLDAPTLSPDDAASELRERLSESVAAQLVSDVPLGLFLSGGLDSSAVAALMAGRPGAAPRSFCIGARSAAEGVDERPWARIVAGRLGTVHQDVEIHPEAFWAALPEAVWFMDEPVADAPAVSLLLLARFARRHVTVALSGEGADEIQAGYGIYRTMLRLERLSSLRGVRLPAVLARTHRARRLREWLGRALDDRYRGVSPVFTRDERGRLLGGAALDGAEAAAAACFDRTRGLHPLQRMLYFDTKVWLPDDLLVKADKMTMAASLELRVPFLDHRLVEWAWRLPPALKLGDGHGKRLLRQALRDVLPAEVLARDKTGFTVGGGPLFAASLARQARWLLVDERGLDGWLDPREVHRLVRRHETGAEDLTEPLFALLVLAWWCRLYLAAPAARPAAPAEAAAA